MHAGSASFIQVGSAFLVTTMVGKAIGEAVGIAPDFALAGNALRSVFAVLHRRSCIDPDAPNSREATEEGVRGGAVELQGVRFHYPCRPQCPVLEDVSLKVGTLCALTVACMQYVWHSIALTSTESICSALRLVRYMICCHLNTSCIFAAQRNPFSNSKLPLSGPVHHTWCYLNARDLHIFFRSFLESPWQSLVPQAAASRPSSLSCCASTIPRREGGRAIAGAIAHGHGREPTQLCDALFPSVLACQPDFLRAFLFDLPSRYFHVTFIGVGTDPNGAPLR